MSKTLDELIMEAEEKWDTWAMIVDNPLALEEVGKTREEALCLANYFEGVFMGLVDAKCLMR